MRLKNTLREIHLNVLKKPPPGSGKSASDALPREKHIYCQPTGPSPLDHRDDSSKTALCHGSLNSRFHLSFADTNSREAPPSLALYLVFCMSLFLKKDHRRKNHTGTSQAAPRTRGVSRSPGGCRHGHDGHGAVNEQRVREQLGHGGALVLLEGHECHLRRLLPVQSLSSLFRKQIMFLNPIDSTNSETINFAPMASNPLLSPCRIPDQSESPIRGGHRTE